MPSYRLYGAKRDADGAIGEPLFERSFVADDDRAAVAATCLQDMDEAPPEVNAFWLTSENGRLLWSLRRANQETS